MDVARQRRLDHLITESGDYAVRGAIRHALGLRRAFRGSSETDRELRDLMREAVHYVNGERLLEQSERSKAAEDRRHRPSHG
jgi:hypothetical protein